MYIIKRSTVNSHTKSLYSKYAVVCCVVSVETLSLILPYKHAAECCRLSWSSWLTVACNARELKAGTHTRAVSIGRQCRMTSGGVGWCRPKRADITRHCRPTRCPDRRQRSRFVFVHLYLFIVTRLCLWLRNIIFYSPFCVGRRIRWMSDVKNDSRHWQPLINQSIKVFYTGLSNLNHCEVH